MGNLGKGEATGRADAEAVAKELTSLAKWRRVTATAIVLAVRELIVARRRSPGKRGSKDANTPVCVGAAGAVQCSGPSGKEARGRGGERAAGVLLPRSFPKRRGGHECCSGALSLAVCPSAQSPPFIRAGWAPRVAVT